MIDLRSIRSVLVVPGHDRRKVAKVRSRGADLVVFDLEDAVPEAFKDEARCVVAATAREGDAIRVNGVDTDRYLADMELVESTGALAMVPKVEVEQLVAIDRCAAILTIESPSAVLDARAIAAHSAMVAFGRVDFMASIGTLNPFSRLVEHAMLVVALAAHAEGKVVSDGPCYDIHNEAVLWAEIARAREVGFSSKGCIHPRQIRPVEQGIRARYELASALAIIGAEPPPDRTVWSVISPPLVRAAKAVING